MRELQERGWRLARRSLVVRNECLLCLTRDDCIHPEAVVLPSGRTTDVIEAGKDVFAEESYLFDEIGQACHPAVRPLRV